MLNEENATHAGDGIDRRGFLRCMQWAGTGLLWTMAGGVPVSQALGQHASGASGAFSFIQISDSHMGFNKDANKDVTATLQAAVDRINSAPTTPDFLIHTGDITHLSKPAEFDGASQILKSAKSQQVFYVPGEHDVLGDNGKQYLERYGAKAQGGGWYSFDHKGVHFIALVNVLDLKAGGMGQLGEEQLEWLEKDVEGKTASTPIVVFAHIPLWSVYPEWGWGTSDSERALAYLKKFGSVTVLNGHIHQTMQKVEGNVTFHTAMSTAFPQPKPGTAPSPGPMKVPDDQLRSVLGLTSVRYVQGAHSLALVDSPLAGGGSSAGEVHIDNFSFTPGSLAVAAGTKVTWTNKDDVPHTVTSTKKKFASPPLDTGEKFTYSFTASGEYPYYCTIHPTMTGKVVVS